MFPPLRPRILVVSSDASLRARLVAALDARYEPAVLDGERRRQDAALAVVDANDWPSFGAAPMGCPAIIVRTTGAPTPLNADAGVRAAFEPSELLEVVETHLELARLRANAAKKEGALARRAEDERERLAFLVSAMDAITNSLDLEDALFSLCTAAVPRLGQWCSIALRSDAVLAAPQVWHESPESLHILQELAALPPAPSDRRHPTRRVLRTGRPEFVERTPAGFSERLAASDEQLRLLRALDVASYMCVPLRSRGRTLGVMTLGADSGWRPLCLKDLVLAEQLATRAGSAIEKAQLHRALENELGERRRAEAALRRQEAEQAVILDTVRAMIWYKDADNRILRCNRAAARSLGKTVAQIQGRRAEDLFPPAAARAYRERDRAVIATGRARIGELQAMKVRGSNRWIQRDILPYRDDKGAVVGVVVIGVDVTELKLAEDRATAKERAEREFLANVSHEFRTPVAAIKGFAQTLREGAWRDDAERSRFLDIIEANSDRLDAMVGDLLTLSELEGSAPLRPAATAVRGVARGCAEKVSARAKRKRLTLDVSVPDDLQVRMNPRHLEQALAQLLDNAVEFTPPGGRVSLSASAPKDEAFITVQDSGVGIARADLPRVFDPFFRVMKGAKPGSPGLGLHLVKKLVGAYDGRVTVSSRPGRGSAFRLALPAAPQAVRK